MTNYILVGHQVLPIADTIEWAQWFETADRRVAFDQVSPEVKVSTVFLGIDHNFWGVGRPLLFETMIFGGPLDQQIERYSTWDEAVEGHQQMLYFARLEASMNQSQSVTGKTE